MALGGLYYVSVACIGDVGWHCNRGMDSMKNASMAVLGCALVFSPCPQAQDIPLERCKYLQEKADDYTRLRKRGGSASKMEAWKRARRKYEDQFREAGCYKYGTAVR